MDCADGDQSQVVDDTNDLGSSGTVVPSEGRLGGTCPTFRASCLPWWCVGLDFNRVSPASLLVPHENLHLLVIKSLPITHKLCLVSFKFMDKVIAKQAKLSKIIVSYNLQS